MTGDTHYDKNTAPGLVPNRVHESESIGGPLCTTADKDAPESVGPDHAKEEDGIPPADLPEHVPPNEAVNRSDISIPSLCVEGTTHNNTRLP